MNRKMLETLADKYLGSASPGISRFQGSPDARYALIAPPPTEIELQRDLVWCRSSAEVFYQMAQQESSLTSRSFLVVPSALTVPSSARVLKQADSQLAREFVSKAIQPKYGVAATVCVGSSAFKAVFGDGKMPEMRALSSATVRSPKFDFHPIIVIPDLTCFDIDQHGQEFGSLSRYEKDIIQREQRKLLTWFVRSDVFKRILKEKL